MSTTSQTQPNALLDRVRIVPAANRDEIAGIAIETAKLQLDRDEQMVERDDLVLRVAEEKDLVIEALNRRIDENIDRLEAWSKANKAEEFGKSKTIRIAGHDLSFRKSAGSVAYLPGFKAAEVVKLILSTKNRVDAERFSKISCTADKNALIKAWKKDTETKELIRSFGIEVIEPELFSFSPNREEIPASSVTKS